jgi:ankyrin repeat protein
MLGKGSMSALHYAAQLGETKIIGRLLQAGKALLVIICEYCLLAGVIVGATRSLLNDKGHSALDIAVTNGHLESANVLRFDPAKVSICMASKHGHCLLPEAIDPSIL